MKIKLGEIADSFGVLRELKDCKLRVPVKYRLGKIFEICDAEVRRYDAAMRELVLQIGGEVKGDMLTFSTDRVSEIEPDVIELRDTEIRIEHFPFSLDDFGNVEIAGDISKLSWLIKDDEIANASEKNQQQASVN